MLFAQGNYLRNMSLNQFHNNHFRKYTNFCCQSKTHAQRTFFRLVFSMSKNFVTPGLTGHLFFF